MCGHTQLLQVTLAPHFIDAIVTYKFNLLVDVDVWTKLTPTGTLFQRAGHTSVYDTISGLSYHIAGTSNGASAKTPTTYGDVWLFDANCT